MLTIFTLLMALAVIFAAACVIHILGCAGRLVFWICGILGVLFFLLLLL